MGTRDAKENQGDVNLERDVQRQPDDSNTHELKALLTQKERELQVHRWRGQAESDSLLAQETLMVSCFHKLGLKYQKLRMQNEDLQRRLSVVEASGRDPVVKNITGLPQTSQSTTKVANNLTQRPKATTDTSKRNVVSAGGT